LGEVTAPYWNLRGLGDNDKFDNKGIKDKLK
jgi:hypothetical protein